LTSAKRSSPGHGGGGAGEVGAQRVGVGRAIDAAAEHYAHLTKDDAYDAMLRVLGAGPVRR
jgi:hypothetical protein